MDFTVNFMQSTTNVWKEAAKLKKYKAMPLAFAIIIGALMLPIAIVSVAAAAVLYVLGYLFSLVTLPVKKLHKLLHEEGQSVKHATQFIIYFLSWSLVFGSYAAMAFFMIMLNVLYSVFSILTYIWTLGGFKFHVFAGEEDISVDVDGKYPTWIPLAYIIAAAALLVVLPLIKTIFTMIDVPEGVKLTFKLILQILKAQVLGLRGWRFLLAATYSVVVFAPFPKKKEEE